jgi:hemerythrin
LHQYEEYPDKSSYDLVFFLNTWLAEHIMKDDKLLGEYLVKKGLSMEAAQKSWFKRVFG